MRIRLFKGTADLTSRDSEALPHTRTPTTTASAPGPGRTLTRLCRLCPCPIRCHYRALGRSVSEILMDQPLRASASRALAACWRYGTALQGLSKRTNNDDIYFSSLGTNDPRGRNQSQQFPAVSRWAGGAWACGGPWPPSLKPGKTTPRISSYQHHFSSTEAWPAGSAPSQLRTRPLLLTTHLRPRRSCQLPHDQKQQPHSFP